MAAATLLLSLTSCSQDVEGTYQFPDVSTGFLVSQDRASVLMGIELWDSHRICGDLVLAEDLGGLSVTYRFTSIYEIKAGIYYGWDFAASTESLGLALLILDF